MLNHVTKHLEERSITQFIKKSGDERINLIKTRFYSITNIIIPI